MAVDWQVEHKRGSEYLFLPENLIVRPEDNWRVQAGDAVKMLRSFEKVGQLQPVSVQNEGGQPVLKHRSRQPKHVAANAWTPATGSWDHSAGSISAWTHAAGSRFIGSALAAPRLQRSGLRCGGARITPPGTSVLPGAERNPGRWPSLSAGGADRPCCRWRRGSIGHRTR